MTTTTVESVQNLRNDLIRKFSVGAAIFADYNAATIADIFTPDGTGLQALPSGYFSAGLTDTAGLATSRSISTSDVQAWQTAEVVRSDVDSDKLQFKAKFIETNMVTIALAENQNLADLGALGSRVTIDRSESGNQPLRRLLMLGLDTQDDIIVGRFLPRVKVTAVGDQQWARTAETTHDFTVDAYRDPAYGTSARYFIGGAGWAALATGAVVSVSVNPSAKALTVAGGAGHTQQLSVAAQYANTTESDVTASATYVSSAPGVATVNASGLVTAVSAGTATITATYSGQSNTCSVTVS
jgi:uncharacterized protein YjdB